MWEECGRSVGGVWEECGSIRGVEECGRSVEECGRSKRCGEVLGFVGRSLVSAW